MLIQENALESVVCEMAAILSRPQCVKPPVCVVAYSKWENQCKVYEFRTYIFLIIQYNFTCYMMVPLISGAVSHNAYCWSYI